jgi:hypothetical protein
MIVKIKKKNKPQINPGVSRTPLGRVSSPDVGPPGSAKMILESS